MVPPCGFKADSLCYCWPGGGDGESKHWFSTQQRLSSQNTNERVKGWFAPLSDKPMVHRQTYLTISSQLHQARDSNRNAAGFKTWLWFRPKTTLIFQGGFHATCLSSALCSPEQACCRSEKTDEAVPRNELTNISVAAPVRKSQNSSESRNSKKRIPRHHNRKCTRTNVPSRPVFCRILTLHHAL